jgi:hypothetical protein
LSGAANINAEDGRSIQILTETTFRHAKASHRRSRGLEPAKIHIKNYSVETINAVAIALARGKKYRSLLRELKRPAINLITDGSAETEIY